VTGNRTGYSGGGVTGCTLKNCTVSFNDSGFGGGANYNCLMINCVLTRNYASYGGGAYNGCTLYNCQVYENTAGGYGGGAHGCTLNHCTISGNRAQLFGGYGGGAYACTLNNSIAYYNTGGAEAADISGSALNYSCAPNATGPNNITNAPLFVSSTDLHLQPGSPCINAGRNTDVTENSQFDLDGNLRIAGGVVDIGAYEFQSAGPLTVSIQASLTNVPVGYPVKLSGVFSKGQADTWDLADGTRIDNQLFITHSWSEPGDYLVALTAFAAGTPGGVTATLMIHVKTQVVYYVNAAATNPVPPYDSWDTAATTLQDAIDAALPVRPSLVLATNGIYQTGGRVVYGSLSNRVVIAKPITVRSLNGPSVTVIQGNPLMGDSAVRCAYLTNNSGLAGFTLASGATRSVGDYTREQSGGGAWCESRTARITDCIFSNNAAVVAGGGVYGGTLTDCTLQSNSVAFLPGTGDHNAPGNGGGAAAAALTHCLLVNNSAGNYGGGADDCALSNCVLAANCALNGGGASLGVLINCSLRGNSAAWEGGGANDINPINNCTITGNSAGRTGGGVKFCIVNNSIVYYNTAVEEPNFSGYSPSGLSYSCTQPMPEGGDGNITDEPQLTDSAHISATSPCRAAGSSELASGRDLDAEPWHGPPSIGCDQFVAGPVNEPLRVSLATDYSGIAAGFLLEFCAQIFGHAASNVWNFGDGTRATNRLSLAHAWNTAGTYAVILTAYNDGNPGGISATVTVHVVSQPIHYVALDSLTPVPPYQSWSTAARSIQEAVDVAGGGATVLVSNGVYQTGGRIIHGALSNRLVINKAITVRSLNGPDLTLIRGSQVAGTTNGEGAVRCVFMSGASRLTGFTVTGGATRDAGNVALEQMGGGVYCESAHSVISNCVLRGNAAANSGGAALRGTYINCLIEGNSALAYAGGLCQGTGIGCTLSNNLAHYNAGGGAQSSALTNCIIVGNRGFYGAGAYYCTLERCTLRHNQATTGAGVLGGTLVNCLLEQNSAANWGGAAYSALLYGCLVRSNSAASLGGGVISCTANNCTIVGNSADGGGGANASTLNNCIAYYNSAANGPNHIDCTANFSCVWPRPGNGIENLTNAPLFAGPDLSNVRLAANSPCINSGRNLYVGSTLDLDGNKRVSGREVDIGAYELQNPPSILSYAWAGRFGFPLDGSADLADTDGDGLNNWQEWVAGTDPTDAASALRILSIAPDPSGLQITWQSVIGRNYALERSTNVGSQSRFTLQRDVIAQTEETSVIDYQPAENAPSFYRVQVQ
jgi:parallel beta-helix repeat protein